MNLLFFTVELERSHPRTRALGDRSRNESPLRKRSFRWILLATAALLCAAAVGWVLAGGGGPFVNDVLDWLPIDTASASAGGGGKARLEITSLPNNATVLVDGHQKGKTPLSLAVIKGAHTLMLTHPAAVDTRRQLDVTADMDVIVSMWRRRPDAMPLKPAYPGASIRGAAFLADGRLTLAMALPGPAGNQADGMMNEAWILDPTSGSLIPFKARSNPRAAIVAVSPDGTNLAYAQPQQSDTRPTTTRPRLTEALVAGAGGSPAVKAFTLPAVNVNPASGSATTNEIEEVHDLAWTPDGRHLLVAVRLVGFAGGYQAAPRSRLLLVDAESTDEQQVAPVELLTLPAEIVAGSYNWDPDGKWVAFLTQATTGPGGTNFVALCAVDTSAGGAVSGFRYVADLGRQSDAVGPLPVAAVAWSPMLDGRLVYAAPTPKFMVSNPLGLPTTSGGEPGVFVATPTGRALTAEEGQRLGSAAGLIAPTWPSADETGETSLVALARSDQGSRPLVLRGIDPVSGTPQNLDIALPATVGGSRAVTARWDATHGRLLVLARHDNSSPELLDYWLVQLRAQAGGE